MSVKSAGFNLRITFPGILLAVVILHASMLTFKGFPGLDFIFFKKEERTVLNIRRVKTPRILNNITTNNLPVRNLKSTASAPNKSNMGLKDLAVLKGMPDKIARPGFRPEATAQKAISQISMQDRSFKDFARSYPGGIADLKEFKTGAFKVSDAAIGIENQDGIEPDELNKNELVYYGFQKRMLVGYINTIVKEIEKFGIKHRRTFQLDPNTKLLMTARLTYDSEGNVKQIKMIRWTHVDEIQNLFETSMKNLNRLNNPPKMLWDKKGEFNVFYNFTITSG